MTCSQNICEATLLRLLYTTFEWIHMQLFFDAILAFSKIDGK